MLSFIWVSKALGEGDAGVGAMVPPPPALAGLAVPVKGSTQCTFQRCCVIRLPCAVSSHLVSISVCV